MAAIFTSVHSVSPTLISKSRPPSSAPVITSRLCLSPSMSCFPSRFTARRMTAAPAMMIVCMAPDEEKLTRRNPLDFPVEWERPKPGRRPDIFPQFSPMKTPLPPPSPYDPPPEDEEEEDEDNKEEEEEDPDKEQQPET